MQHLSEEQLVAHYYHDADDAAGIESHLRECRTCAAQMDEIRRLLALVSEAPVAERGETYGQEVWTRLRWKLGSPRRRRWQPLAAVAAVLVVAFLAGQWWSARKLNVGPAMPAEQGSAKPAGRIAGPTQGAATLSTDPEASNRILVVVVSDHLEASERMLLEVANADPGQIVRNPHERAEELVASNRIYRQTAAQRGDARIANVLSEIEPILVELSHAGTTLRGEELVELQKRIEAKGLLFKVRVSSNEQKVQDTNL